MALAHEPQRLTGTSTVCLLLVTVAGSARATTSCLQTIREHTIMEIPQQLRPDHVVNHRFTASSFVKILRLLR